MKTQFPPLGTIQLSLSSHPGLPGDQNYVKDWLINSFLSLRCKFEQIGFPLPDQFK